MGVQGGFEFNTDLVQELKGTPDIFSVFIGQKRHSNPYTLNTRIQMSSQVTIALIGQPEFCEFSSGLVNLLRVPLSLFSEAINGNSGSLAMKLQYKLRETIVVK